MLHFAAWGTMYIVAVAAFASTESSVRMYSSLKQNSLCPGDTGVIFICDTQGIYLGWEVELGNYNITVPFNWDKQSGAFRANIAYACVLFQRSLISDEGLGVRTAGLYLKANPDGHTDPITVSCNNGTRALQISQQFYFYVADPPLRPNMSAIVAVDTANEVLLTITWTQPPASPAAIYEIDHYVVTAGTHPPVLTSNITANLVVNRQPGETISIAVQAVDKCSQVSEPATAPYTFATSQPATTLIKNTLALPKGTSTIVNNSSKGPTTPWWAKNVLTIEVIMMMTIWSLL